MIPRDAKPIGHVPPYKPVDLWGPRPPTKIIDPLSDETKAVLRQVHLREADRMWAITRQVAEGCNQPPVTAPEVVAPEVCTDGWEAA